MIGSLQELVAGIRDGGSVALAAAGRRGLHQVGVPTLSPIRGPVARDIAEVYPAFAHRLFGVGAAA